MPIPTRDFALLFDEEMTTEDKIQRITEELGYLAEEADSKLYDIALIESEMLELMQLRKTLQGGGG